MSSSSDLQTECCSALSLLKSFKDKSFSAGHRDYMWGAEQCTQLFESINALDYRKERLFLGTMLFCQNALVDGKQRYISLLLLALAVEKIAPKSQSITGYLPKPNELPKIEDNLEKNKLLEKLISFTNPDSKIIFNEDEQSETIFRNFEYFRSLLESASRNNRKFISEFSNKLEQADIIRVVLDKAYQTSLQVYENANAKLLPLSESDRIFNLIDRTMTTGVSSSSTLDNIIKHTNGRTDEFFSCFLSIKLGFLVTEHIYSHFEMYLRSLSYTEADSLSLLGDMDSYANCFGFVYGNVTLPKLSKNETKEAQSKLAALRSFDVNGTLAFAVETLYLFLTDDFIKPKDLLGTFDLVEQYIVRRAVCNERLNSISDLLVRINQYVMRDDSKVGGYLDKLTSWLFFYAERYPDQYRFPDSDEFRECLSTRSFYRRNDRSINYYLLARFQDKFSPSNDLFRRLYTDSDFKYTIEHIMPQSLTPEWRQELGDEALRVHAEWLHRLGNLILIDQPSNSQNSNRPYRDKQENLKRFLSQNAEALPDHWNEASIEARHNKLLELRTSIWPDPKAKQLTPKEICMSLKDSVYMDLNHDVIKYQYFGQEKKCSNWRELFCSLIAQIQRIDPTGFSLSISVLNNEGNEHKLFAQEGSDGFTQLTDRLYIKDSGLNLKGLEALFALLHQDLNHLTLWYQYSELQSSSVSSPSQSTSKRPQRQSAPTQETPLLQQSTVNTVEPLVSDIKTNVAADVPVQATPLLQQATINTTAPAVAEIKASLMESAAKAAALSQRTAVNTFAPVVSDIKTVVADTTSAPVTAETVAIRKDQDSSYVALAQEVLYQITMHSTLDYSMPKTYPEVVTKYELEQHESFAAVNYWGRKLSAEECSKLNSYATHYIQLELYSAINIPPDASGLSLIGFSLFGAPMHLEPQNITTAKFFKMLIVLIHLMPPNAYEIIARNRKGLERLIKTNIKSQSHAKGYVEMNGLTPDSPLYISTRLGNERLVKSLKLILSECNLNPSEVKLIYKVTDKNKREKAKQKAKLS